MGPEVACLQLWRAWSDPGSCTDIVYLDPKWTSRLWWRSVLMHGLPGLALFMHRHFPPPAAALEGLRHVASHLPLISRAVLAGSCPAAASTVAEAPQLWQRDTPTTLLWSFLMPVVFYGLWQLGYFLLVQVSCLGHCSDALS